MRGGAGQPTQALSAYGRLVLATHERMMAGGLVACDWLRPVTRGAWCVAPPISVVEHADVS